MIEIKLPVEKFYATDERLAKYIEIFTVLIEKGALDGVRGGSTLIHFDGDGNFMGIQLSYWPWKRRGKML